MVLVAGSDVAACLLIAVVAGDADVASCSLIVLVAEDADATARLFLNTSLAVVDAIPGFWLSAFSLELAVSIATSWLFEER